MKKIVLASDSTCDLSREIIDQLDIKIVPLSVLLGDQTFKDDGSIPSEKIFEFVKDSGNLPKTSACTIEEFKEFFKEISNNGEFDVIYTGISGEMSSTFNNAVIASSEVDYVYPYDSKNLSTGIGIQLVYAYDLIHNQGVTDVKEVVKKLEYIRDYVQASFVLDKLKYLHMGGRCSTLALLGANLINIKPSILVKDGTMGVGKKYVGKINKVALSYTRDILEKFNNYNKKWVFITYSSFDDQSTVDEIENKLKTVYGFETVYKTRAGCTVTSHCGPNTLGVLYINSQE